MKPSGETTMNNEQPICKVNEYGDKYWLLNDKLHRVDGPTINGAILKLMKNNNNPICEVDEYGTKYWYLNGELHREDGPAVEDTDGNKGWLLNGQLHREDGPAAEYADGSKYWYVNDEKIEVPNNDNDIFLRMINLKAFW